VAEKKGATRLTPPTPKTENVGRRYTRKERTTFADGGGHEQLDLDRAPSLRARRARAVDVLKAAGIPVAQLLGDPPSGSLLIERVIHLDGNELDSPLGLAAQIVAACCELQQWAALGEANPRVVQNAYLLGYLVALQKVYDRETQATSAAAKAHRSPRKGHQIREKLTKIMRGMHRDGSTLKQAIASLVRHQHDDLSIVAIKDSDRFEIADDESGETSAYSWKSMEALWTAAGKGL
jgi:hypothetical protein